MNILKYIGLILLFGCILWILYCFVGLIRHTLKREGEGHVKT